MQNVILLERVPKLGQMGDIVRVKDGHARNFLFPKGRAMRASEDNVKRFEADRAQLEAKNLEARKEAEAVAGRLNGEMFNLLRMASDRGLLYGSVSTRHIAEAVTEAGYTVDRRQVVLTRPIKDLGLHPVQVVLHPEVEIEVTLNVARTEEEAAMQASGRTIQDQQAEDEAAAEFEIQELFDDIGSAAGDDDGDSGMVDTPENRN